VVVEVVHFLVVVNPQDLEVLVVEVLVVKVLMEQQDVLTLVEAVEVLEEVLVSLIGVVVQVALE
tara:strand:- start:41 stop:232 length:192 start_codon:yes stop_codon:yes gene_type:complete